MSGDRQGNLSTDSFCTGPPSLVGDSTVRGEGEASSLGALPRGLLLAAGFDEARLVGHDHCLCTVPDAEFGQQ